MSSWVQSTGVEPWADVETWIAAPKTQTLIRPWPGLSANLQQGPMERGELGHGSMEAVAWITGSWSIAAFSPSKEMRTLPKKGQSELNYWIKIVM